MISDFSKKKARNSFPRVEKRLYLQSQLNGLVVQLVRIHACHAWGRGFESRPDR